MKQSPSLLYLVPDLFGPPGGIARYCRMVCQAINDEGIALKVIALLDRPGQSARARTAERIEYEACSGSRPLFIRRALTAAANRRPAIVLIGHPNFSPLGWMCARMASASALVFVYGIDGWKTLPPLRRKMLQRMDRVLTISRFTGKQVCAANGVSEKRVRVLHNCLDPGSKTRNGAGNPHPHSMLTVARMQVSERYKGHDHVIGAMPRLLEQFPDLAYNIVGDGSLRPELEALAVAEGVAGSVHFHGTVSDSELEWHYAHNSIFIMPSRAEGFGFVFLEAMSHGLPVIGGNADATPEVVVHGKTGYLVNPKSVCEITDAASRLLGNSELRREMGCAAKKHVATHFDFPSFRMKLLGYLAELRPDLF